jgi:hypothetical protein
MIAEGGHTPGVSEESAAEKRVRYVIAINSFPSTS